jgi:NifB/MoaA-like Fe-S oxidoreductase
MRIYRRDEAESVMDRVARWQTRFMAETGGPFVYLSDEWYYLTHRPFPRARHYGDYAQIENGVGMTRHLLDAWQRARRNLPAPHAVTGRVALITATMAESVMRRITDDIRTATNLDVRLIPIENRFFGPTTTVAGLLCGQDVLDTIHERCADLTRDDLILLPRVMLDNAGTRFLDDITLEQFRDAVTPRVEFLKSAEEVVSAVRSLAPATSVGTPAHTRVHST